jgi:hypothetical protein
MKIDLRQAVMLAICSCLVILLLISIPTYTETSSDGSQWTHHYIGDSQYSSNSLYTTEPPYLIYTWSNTQFQIIVVVALLMSIVALLSFRIRSLTAETKSREKAEDLKKKLEIPPP